MLVKDPQDGLGRYLCIDTAWFVIDQLALISPHSLLSLCLVSRTFHSLCIKAIYRWIVLDISQSRSVKLLGLLQHNEQLRQHVRTVTIESAPSDSPFNYMELDELIPKLSGLRELQYVCYYLNHM